MTQTNGGAVRVLICDDSPTYAAGLSRLLGRGREIEVVGICPTAEEALLELPRLKPDLLTMDLHLPGMSGLEAVEQVMGSSPLPILVISSRIASRDSTLVASALAAGALDAVSKNDLDGLDPAGPAGAALRRRVKLLSHARVIRHPRGSLHGPTPAVRRPARPCAAVAIVASTGGPPALARVLRQLPASYAIPIVVVQHIASGFVEGFAKWLGSEIPLPVKLAPDGGSLDRGVWIAPEGAHLVLRSELRFFLDCSESSGFAHRPSGDVLLRSVARALGREATGVVLTGMGKDGAAGLAAIRAAGGATIVQDEDTSAVYGMPKVAAESADAVLGIDEIGQRLALLRPPEVPR